MWGSSFEGKVKLRHVDWLELSLSSAVSDGRVTMTEGILCNGICLFCRELTKSLTTTVKLLVRPRPTLKSRSYPPPLFCHTTHGLITQWYSCPTCIAKLQVPIPYWRDSIVCMVRTLLCVCIGVWRLPGPKRHAGMFSALVSRIKRDSNCLVR